MAQILIVDDELDMLALLDMIITEKTNHKVTTNNPLEVPKLITEGGYNLLITDLKMPGMDGIELIDEIRKIDKCIPIFMITGHGSTESAEEAINKGAYDYITKPFRKEQILTAVNRALEWQGIKQDLKNSIKKLTLGPIAKDRHPVGVERRRYRRVPCEIPIFYSPVDRQLSGISRTINISSRGIMFHADQAIAEGKFLNLALALPTPPKIKTVGVVRWTSRTKDMPHRLGVEFSQVRNEDEKRIADHIYT
jgi:CheY-like chemotaxis protein